MKSNQPVQIFILIILMSLSFSCRIFKDSRDTDKEDFTLDDVKIGYSANMGSFSSISVPRMNITLITDNIETGLRGNLRLVSDSAIFVSVNAGLGIEIARAFLQPENIQVIDRINSSYDIMNYNQIGSILGIDANYRIVENLLFNSFEFDNLLELTDFSLFNDKNNVVVYDKGNRLIEGFDEARIYFRKRDFLISKIELFDTKTRYFAFIEYNEFTDAGGGIVFPHEIKVFVNRGGEISELKIRYLRLELNTVKTLNFVIPSRYL